MVKGRQLPSSQDDARPYPDLALSPFATRVPARMTAMPTKRRKKADPGAPLPTFGEVSRYALYRFNNCCQDIAGVPCLASNGPLHRLLCGRVERCSRVCWRPGLTDIQEPLKKVSQRLLAILSTADTHSEALASFIVHKCRHIPHVHRTHHV